MVHGQPASVKTSDKMNGGKELPEGLVRAAEGPAGEAPAESFPENTVT